MGDGLDGSLRLIFQLVVIVPCDYVFDGVGVSPKLRDSGVLVMAKAPITDEPSN